MLKIRGISNAENLLSGVNGFSHCLTPGSATEVRGLLHPVFSYFLEKTSMVSPGFPGFPRVLII